VREVIALEVWVPEVPVHAFVMSGLFSDTEHDAVFVDVHEIAVVFPDRTSCGAAVMDTEGTGGAEHCAKATSHPYAHACDMVSAQLTARYIRFEPLQKYVGAHTVPTVTEGWPHVAPKSDTPLWYMR
jgi:hypothetical protein